MFALIALFIRIEIIISLERAVAMKILVTGFDPFGTDRVNPALEVVKRLPNEIKGVQIIKLEIPTKFNVCAQVVHRAIQQEGPDYVLNIGQAGGRNGITPERIAINLDDAKTVDNAGVRRINQLIQQDGQPAYFTQLPIKAMVAAIRNRGIISTISNSVGTYVCNHIMYQVQYMRDKEFPNIKAGFIHIPLLPEQVTQRHQYQLPSLSLETDAVGIIAALNVMIDRDGKKDLFDY